MHFDAFAFFISILNFGVMFVLFNQVVIVPMEEAVALRRKKVTARLDEIRDTLVKAQKLESEVKEQYSKLDGEKVDMRQATEHEIARVKEHTAEQAQKDAEHLVAKTRRESEKVRQDALVALNRQLTERALDKVEGLISKAFDQKAQGASAQYVLEKAVQRAS